jgi:transposase-like protein
VNAKKPGHSPEVRAAVIAALMAGQSVSQVAKAYKLPKGTVSNWKNRKADGVRADETQKADGSSIGDLLVQLVRENLKGLIAVSSLLQDAAWLRTQGAAEIGTLAGITHDKTTRMLEALAEQGETLPADAT